MKIKKKKGEIEFFISSIILAVVVLIMMMGMRLNIIKSTQEYVEDGLVASNLAAATIDLNEFGSSNNIINNNFEQSFNDYKEALKINLNLDNNFVPKSKTLINSKVNIEEFTIYNVVGNDVQMTRRSSNGNIDKITYANKLGTIKTPNGVEINSTTIYSKIGFQIKGYLKDTHYVYKENSVDIVKN